MPNPFAAATKVPVERTRSEIESLVVRYGAEAFRSGWNQDGTAQIEFLARKRLVRFTLKFPPIDDKRFARSPGGRKALTSSERTKAWEQACRQKWRAMLLVIKAKLEAVDAGISVFDDEFLAQLVDPITGRTVGDTIRPALLDRYAGMDKPLALPAPEGVSP